MSDAPYVLAPNKEAKAAFKSMVDRASEIVLASTADNKAYSGLTPYVLREKIRELGFFPDHGIGFDEIMDKVESEIAPSMLKTWSTLYMPHLHSPALLESIATSLIINAFNDSMDSWDQGPAATEIETLVIEGLLELFGFDKAKGDGVFTSGGSQSNISALTAARDSYAKERLYWDVKKNGLPPSYDKLVLYTSEISHFSMEKGAHMLGLGYKAVRKLPIDDKARVDIAAFKSMVESDIKAGYLPFLAVATIGTTDFGSIDDIAAMREICDKYGMHLHADAAYGSGAILSSLYKERLGDLSLADSITVDFHKMFLLPISCSAILVKKKEDLECFELHADYLNREEDEEDGFVNLVGKSLQTTRPFDALKVFVSFQMRGRDGYGKIIDKVIENASYFYSLLTKDRVFYAPVSPELSSVVFALEKSDDVNKAVRRELLEEGIVIGQTVYKNRVMLKFTLLNPALTHSEIDSLLLHIKALGNKL